jgi:hypothetical protein
MAGMHSLAEAQPPATKMQSTGVYSYCVHPAASITGRQLRKPTTYTSAFSALSRGHCVIAIKSEPSRSPEACTLPRGDRPQSSREVISTLIC